MTANKTNLAKLLLDVISSTFISTNRVAQHSHTFACNAAVVQASSCRSNACITIAPFIPVCLIITTSGGTIIAATNNRLHNVLLTL